MDDLYSSWSEGDSLWMTYTPHGVRLIVDDLYSSWSEGDSLWMTYTPHGVRETHCGWPILLME